MRRGGSPSSFSCGHSQVRQGAQLLLACPPLTCAAASAAISGSVPLSTRDARRHWEPRALLWRAPGQSPGETGSAVWPCLHAHTHGATAVGIPAGASLLLVGE